MKTLVLLGSLSLFLFGCSFDAQADENSQPSLNAVEAVAESGQESSAEDIGMAKKALRLLWTPIVTSAKWAFENAKPYGSLYALRSTCEAALSKIKRCHTALESGWNPNQHKQVLDDVSELAVQRLHCGIKLGSGQVIDSSRGQYDFSEAVIDPDRCEGKRMTKYGLTCESGANNRYFLGDASQAAEACRSTAFRYQYLDKTPTIDSEQDEPLKEINAIQ